MRASIRNLPFKFRIFFGFLLVALIPLLFSGIFIVGIFDTSLQRQSNAELTYQVDEIHERLDQLFQSSQDICRNLSSSDFVYRAMIDNTRIEVQQDLYVSLYEIIQQTYGYTSLSIYDIGGKLQFTTDTSTSPAELPIHWGLLRKASNHTDVVYYRTDPHLTTTPGITLQIACSLENSLGSRTGYVVLNFSDDSFHRVLNMNTDTHDVLILLDSFGEVFYCSRPAYSDAQINAILEKSKEQGQHSNALYDSSIGQTWDYTSILQKSAPISASSVVLMRKISLLISILALLLCLIFSLALSRQISRPVSQLNLAMRKVQKGNLSVQISNNRKDELGLLSDNFNRMTKELQTHLEMAVQKQKDLDEANLKLYQSQLNPHFLYNTLDTIKWSGKINGNVEIPVLAENLAIILRRSISAEPFITLSNELASIRYYIEIQKIRFTGHFTYDEEIPNQLENCLLPKMILQPLVENAIIHGLDACKHGHICIYATTTQATNGTETLHISVADDGCGISSEMIAWANNPSPHKRSGHIGLYNVIQILKTYYGKEYGLHAELNPDGGSTVTISLPLERKEFICIES